MSNTTQTKTSNYLQSTYAVTFNEDGKWLFAKSNQCVTLGKGLSSLVALIKSLTRSKKKKIIVWNYRLSEMVAWSGEENYDTVEKHSLNSFIVKFAKIDNIIFKNTKEFYRTTLLKIAEELNINSTNELSIVWQAAEHERLRNDGFISKIPMTAVGYVGRQINTLKGFYTTSNRKQGFDLYRLGQSITPETHKLIVDCKNGGLCGVDTGRLDSSINVNCYDFKSFYPWVMVSQVFPKYRYKMLHNINKARFDYFNEMAEEGRSLWIGRFKFKYIKAKEIDWLGFNGTISKEYCFTNLDYKIIQEDYDFEVEEITEFIPFVVCEKLPKSLRDYIIKQFNNKETFEKDTAEYAQAKVFLNCIYGLFNQNQEKYDKEIDCYRAKQRPLVIGKFVAAYGRYYLWEVMHNHNPLHWDTDGFKTEDLLVLDDYNKARRLKDDKGRLIKNDNGEDIMLGQLMCENKFVSCTVFGNKQYMLDNKLKIAGTNGDLAMEYFNKNNIIPSVGAVIPAEYTNRVSIKDHKIINVPYTIGSKNANSLSNMLSNIFDNSFGNEIFDIDKEIA